MKLIKSFSILSAVVIATSSLTGIAGATENHHAISTESVTHTENSSIISQSEIEELSNGIQTQEVLLENGVSATLTLDKGADTFTISTDNGQYHEIDLNDARDFLDENTSTTALRTNACDVATGAAGIGHSALWSAALGGGVGLAAGAAVGAFWWAVSQGC